MEEAPTRWVSHARRRTAFAVRSLEEMLKIQDLGVTGRKPTRSLRSRRKHADRLARYCKKDDPIGVLKEHGALFNIGMTAQGAGRNGCSRTSTVREDAWLPACDQLMSACLTGNVRSLESRWSMSGTDK